RLYEHDRCFIFQNRDGRIVFTIPYEDDFTLIGTTDRDYDGDLDRVRASKEEVSYLCAAVGAYFRRPVTPADVVWSYSGVRPLYDDGASAAQTATRDYVLELDRGGGAPMLSIFGGKITTYRRLAEEAIDRLAPCFEDGLADRLRETAGWTGRTALPGGDFAPGDFPALVAALAAACPGLGRREAARLVRYHGTRAEAIFGGVRSFADLGRHFGHGLTERELAHMCDEEWASTAEDVLWRRSKLGLHLDEAAIAAVADYFDGERRAA
ncbi:MAG: FAD-dependent oxidoreductase, partial [Phyllobacteriaceae bacterium]|nr:FAD-dependent oxidoreductase [Phyllobacteriaceae bacterium]